jgi:uncharacterized protein
MSPQSDPAKKANNHKGPTTANVDEKIIQLMLLDDEGDLLKYADILSQAIAFVHFDPNTAKSNMVEGLVHFQDISKVHRGLYVHIVSMNDNRRYTGRLVEGPFYDPDVLKRDSTPVRFIVLNQGQGKVLALPEYHGWVQIEILGEERGNEIVGATRRPHPASPIIPYDSTLMAGMLRMRGKIILGMLDSYEDVLVRIDENDKGVVPRNWLTVGTVGSGKSNTNQVFIEETLEAKYAQIVIDPEGEYIYMDQPSDVQGIEQDLENYTRIPQGISNITVYCPPLSKSKRSNAQKFSVPFDSLSPEIIIELTEMNSAQQFRFAFLYEQAIQCVRKDRQANQGKVEEREELDISLGFPGITLNRLITMLDEELEYYHWKQANENGKEKPKKGKKQEIPDTEYEEGDFPKMEIYCHRYRLKPLIQDQQDLVSYAALRKKLKELEMTRIFDRGDAPKLDMKKLCQPGHLSVLDMSDSHSQQITNIVIADLLARTYEYKMKMTEEENAKNKVFLTIEEAHGFISRDKSDKMQQTLDQLRKIARRGRKRWLALHLVTQSPQHLPSELFELANNKIIHQTTGTENLRVLKAAAGSVNEAIWDDVPSLGRGRAIVISGQYPHPIIVRIRPAASKRNYMT